MNDRELLKAAAKAAGYRLDGLASKHVAQGVGPDDMLLLNDKGGHSVWNPLTDDGDALRLAVKVLNWPRGGQAFDNAVSAMFAVGQLPNDPYAATRRAIVRAAASLQKDTP